jgi:hypothetical protein
MIDLWADAIRRMARTDISAVQAVTAAYISFPDEEPKQIRGIRFLITAARHNSNRSGERFFYAREQLSLEH